MGVFPNAGKRVADAVGLAHGGAVGVGDATLEARVVGLEGDLVEVGAVDVHDDPHVVLDLVAWWIVARRGAVGLLLAQLGLELANLRRTARDLVKCNHVRIHVAPARRGRHDDGPRVVVDEHLRAGAQRAGGVERSHAALVLRAVKELLANLLHRALPTLVKKRGQLGGTLLAQVAVGEFAISHQANLAAAYVTALFLKQLVEEAHGQIPSPRSRIPCCHPCSHAPARAPSTLRPEAPRRAAPHVPLQRPTPLPHAARPRRLQFAHIVQAAHFAARALPARSMLRTRPFTHALRPTRTPPCHALRNPRIACVSPHRMLRARPFVHLSPLPRTRRARHLSVLRMPPRRENGKSMRFNSKGDYRLKTGQVRHAIYQALFKQADSI